MATIDTIKVNAAKALSDQTILIKVVGAKRLGWRIAIGSRLIKIAAKIIGVNVEISGPFATGGYVAPGKRYVVGEQPNEFRSRRLGS